MRFSISSLLTLAVAATSVASQPTCVASAFSAETSSVTKCNILVQYRDNGKPLGFISEQWDNSSAYSSFRANQYASLEVSFSYSPNSNKQLDLLATNGRNASYPFFGAVTPSSYMDEDLNPDSRSFLFLTGTTQTAPGATPSYEASTAYGALLSHPGASESAIWSYDPITRRLTAWWVNKDGSSVNARIFWIKYQARDEGMDSLVLAHSSDTMRHRLGFDGPEVTFTCMPSVYAASP
ncbi:hypothetical protein FRC11_005048 [Ceratobasidium sp. 423]|nr:hypothetical protein FRC11_005048 [Ceratobasidium sp. 423]